MNLLLDTAPLLWLLLGSDRVTRSTRDLLADSGNDLYASVVSAWEMAIKLALRKLPVPPDIGGWLPRELAAMRATLLPITLAHAAAVEHLLPHHRDPFDRLLIAQAMAEGLTIVTADSQFQRYPVRLIPC